MLRKAKKPLTPLQALKCRQVPKRPTIPELIRKADKEFSRYVRLRDSAYVAGEWRGECITCGRKLVVVAADGRWNPAANLGHYIGRAKKSLRWDEYNCNLQCAHCNAWRDKVDMLDRYAVALANKYGEDVLIELDFKAKEDHKPTRQELVQLIEDSKEWVEYTLAHPKGA